MYGNYSADTIDIDNIGIGVGYMLRISNGQYVSGTFPSGLSSKAGIIIGCDKSIRFQILFSSVGELYRRNGNNTGWNAWYKFQYT